MATEACSCILDVISLEVLKALGTRWKCWVFLSTSVSPHCSAAVSPQHVQSCSVCWCLEPASKKQSQNMQFYKQGSHWDPWRWTKYNSKRQLICFVSHGIHLNIPDAEMRRNCDIKSPKIYDYENLKWKLKLKSNSFLWHFTKYLQYTQILGGTLKLAIFIDTYGSNVSVEERGQGLYFCFSLLLSGKMNLFSE